MKRVLLTGSSGFVGRHAIGALQARGYEVHAVSRTPLPADAAEGAHQHSVNLMVDHEVTMLMERIQPSHLLHLAWYAVPGLFWTAPENLDWVAVSLRPLRRFSSAG